MKRIMKEVHYLLQKEEIRISFILAVQFSFMICFFGSLNWYIPNKNEFWFSGWQLLVGDCLSFFILLSVFVLVILFLRKNKKLSFFFFVVTLTMDIYLYIQGNYIPRDYGILNGEKIQWNDFKGYAITSIVLLVVCLVLGITLYICKKRTYIIGKYIAIFLLLIQIITIGTLLIQNAQGGKQESKRITKENIATFSEDSNIIVFILDSFDSSYMKDILSKNGNYGEVVKDFTYYPDTVGAYATTKGALPFIMTGIWNNNSMAYKDYIAQAYHDTKVFDELLESGYLINIYPGDSSYVSMEMAYYSNNIHEGSYLINDILGFSWNSIKLTLFNYLPHQMKRFFWVDTNDFNKWKTSEAIYDWDIIKFSDYMQNVEFDLRSNNPTFKVYHLTGTHSPYSFDETFVENKREDYSVMDEAYGNVEFLRLMFEKMKDEGIYDNSTIIVMADHGNIELKSNPLFMIKNRKEQHENLLISDVKVSYENLDDLFITLANQEVVDELFFASQENDMRKYCFYQWKDGDFDRDYLPTITEYVCKGPANVIESYYLTGNVFQDEEREVDYKYELGEILDFTSSYESGNPMKYTVYGMVSPEKAGTWTSDSFVNMRYDVSNDNNNLLMKFEISNVYDGKQEVLFQVNGYDLCKKEVKGGDKIALVIPKEYIIDETLNLMMNIPNAQISNNGDKRKLGICISSVCISIIDEEEYYQIGSVISFGKNGNYEEIVENGFFGWDHWTTAEEGELSILLEEESDLELKLDYGIAGEKQHIIVYAGDNLVADYFAFGLEKKIIHIPKEYIDNHILNVRFELPDAKKAENGDSRKLGLYMNSIVIDKETLYYELGDEISFGKEGTINRYCENGGFSDDSWTITNNIIMRFLVSEKESEEDLLLTMCYSTYGVPQTVIIKANGIEIANYVTDNEEIKKVYIPKDCRTNGYLEIEMELPDAKEPENGDSRKLALHMRLMTINKADVSEYELGTELSFGNGGTINDYCDEGAFSDDCWTVSDIAVMRFLTYGEDLQLTMSFSTCGPSQEVIIKANGQKIADFVAQGDMTHTLEIPNECRVNDYLEIEMDFPDAKTPDNGDMRQLALRMYSLVIDEKEQ